MEDKKNNDSIKINTKKLDTKDSSFIEKKNRVFQEKKELKNMLQQELLM